jgi:hypothetical protein
VAISKETVGSVVAAINKWERRWPFYQPAVPELLRTIADVQGNQSFAASMAAVVEEYEARRKEASNG